MVAGGGAAPGQLEMVGGRRATACSASGLFANRDSTKFVWDPACAPAPGHYDVSLLYGLAFTITSSFDNFWSFCGLAPFA